MAELELPSEKVAEAHEHSHHEDDRRIGLAISILAVLLAIAGTLGKKSDNNEIVSRVAASNTWSYYQAKRTRGAQMEQTHDLIGLISGARASVRSVEARPGIAVAGAELLQKYAGDQERYRKEAEEIQEKAKSYEEQAERFERRGDLFDLAELIFQVALVLCSVTILTRIPTFYRSGVGISVVALGIVAYALLRF